MDGVEFDEFYPYTGGRHPATFSVK